MKTGCPGNRSDSSWSLLWLFSRSGVPAIDRLKIPIHSRKSNVFLFADDSLRNTEEKTYDTSKPATFIVPYLARHAPDFIAQIEETSTETPVLVFRTLFFLTVLIFSLGFLLYGIAIVRTHTAPKIAGISLAIGAPLFWIGALFVSKSAMGNLITEIGAFLLGVGLVIFGSTRSSKPFDMSNRNPIHNRV